MIKKHQIYKHDKYNMLNVEVHGKTLIVTEISDQWGEECHTFVSRPEMMHWAENRFRAADYAGREEELALIMETFPRSIVFRAASRKFPVLPRIPFDGGQMLSWIQQLLPSLSSPRSAWEASS